MSCIFYRKAEPDKRKPLRYGTIVSNGGFLGNPVIEGIYGTNGLFYASVFMLPVRIVMWSVGTSCFMKEKSESFASIFYRADKLSRDCIHCKARQECYWPEEKKNNKYIY